MQSSLQPSWKTFPSTPQSSPWQFVVHSLSPPPQPTTFCLYRFVFSDNSVMESLNMQAFVSGFFYLA